MKFLCDQCKAKYQIADEKVAGKTVRMKCRKCGHMIEVRAAVTETSVSVDIPREENPAAAGGAPNPKGGPPAKPAPPKPTGGALATSFASARPVGSRPPLSAQTRPETGLASAFQKSVQKDDEAALEMLELHAADEWYVAINGVPVGPVRMTELRRKAATGAVTEDSLVWQEGLEEWRPVKAINELAAVVREAIAGGRVSLATPPPPEARISAPPPPPRGAPPAPARPATAPGAFLPPRPGGMTPSPPAAMPAAARNNVVPITGRGSAGALATAERLDAPPANPFAPTPAPAVVADPFALPPPASAASPIASSASSPPIAPIPPPYIASATPSLLPAAPTKKSPPWIAIAMVVLAGAFGITAAIIVLTRPPQQPVVIQMPSAQPTATTPPPPVTDDVPAPDPNASAVAAAGTDAGPGRTAAMHGGSGGTKAGGAGTSAAPAPTNSAIAALLGNTAGGPTPGGPATTGGGGGSQLTSDQIEAVVRAHQTGVKRTCFERIATDKTGTVQVTVNATVGGGGAVQSVTATGNDPTIAKCIEGAVRGWQFPATGAQSQIQIPFKFVRQ